MIDIVTREITVVSEANRRDHWARKARRAKQQRTMASWLVRGFWFLDKSKKPTMPLVITLTRLGARTLDSDNLAGSFKAVRDGIADALGVNDGSKDLDWRYRQAHDKPAGIRIQIQQGEWHSRDEIVLCAAPGTVPGSLADRMRLAKPGDVIVVEPSLTESQKPARRQGRSLRAKV